MTFENVLNVFADYLREDTDCEVINTKHGYTVLIWDSRGQEWSLCEYCGTPEALRDTLLGTYWDFTELHTTHARRELTEEERARIEASCDRLREQCE